MTPSELPRRVAVVGLGVVGGSLARALSGLPDGPEVVGAAADPADRRAALDAGAVSEAPVDPRDALSGTDLVVYATPLSATLELMETHRSVWEPRAVITDVASLKAPVARRVAELGLSERWVGSHPMAGGEGSGFGASRADLFSDVRVWLTPGEGAGPERTALVRAVWSALGARPAEVDPDLHDARMVRVSHLPQLTATALARLLASEGEDPGALGPGGRDMTRLAGSGPEMWRDLLAVSGEEAAALLRRLAVLLEEMAESLSGGDPAPVEEWMRETRAWTEGKPWS